MKRAILIVAALALLFGSVVEAKADLIVNGSFETGDFTGWTQFGDTSFTFVSGNLFGPNPTDGSYQAYFGPQSPPGGGITQTVATTVGQRYALSFDLYNFGDLGNGPVESYMVTAGPLTLVNVPDASAAFPYTTFTYLFTASAASTAISFTFVQQPSFFLLDNVQLTATLPEPASVTLLGIGIAGIAGYSWRRRKMGVA